MEWYSTAAVPRDSCRFAAVRAGTMTSAGMTASVSHLHTRSFRGTVDQTARLQNAIKNCHIEGNCFTKTKEDVRAQIANTPTGTVNIPRRSTAICFTRLSSSTDALCSAPVNSFRDDSDLNVTAVHDSEAISTFNSNMQAHKQLMMTTVVLKITPHNN